MSAHNSSHGAKKEKEKARVEAQKARARQAQPKPDMITSSSSLPLFDGPKKVINPMDQTSQKAQQVLGSYGVIKPYDDTRKIIGVTRQPSTPLVSNSKSEFFPSSKHQNGQHKIPEKKADPNRSFNFPNSHSKEAISNTNSRKSLPQFPISSHDRSSSRSPVKVHPFSHHSSPKKPPPPTSRASTSPVSSHKTKLTLESYRSGLTNQKTDKSSLNTAQSHDDISPSDTHMPVSSQNSQNSQKSTSGMKGPVTPPNGIIDPGKSVQRNNLPKLIISQNKNLDEIFSEMTDIPPPLTGIQTPRKSEDKFPFPTQKVPSNGNLSFNTSTDSINDLKVEEKIQSKVERHIPDQKIVKKPKTDLAERGATVAMKPTKIKRTRSVSSSSESSSSSSSESGSESDSNNSDDEEEEDEIPEKDQEKEKEKESKKDLDRSVESTSSTESQRSQPIWDLNLYKPKKTSPLSQSSSSVKVESEAASRIDDENNALLDEMVKSIPGKNLKDIGHSATLPFEIPSDDDDDVTLPGCDMDRSQNGVHDDDESKINRNNCSPSALSSCSSSTNFPEMVSKTSDKHKSAKKRLSSSNKSTSEKRGKDSKSPKMAISSDSKPEEKKRKSLSTKRKKPPKSKTLVDSDSDIDVDVVSVTPENKGSTSMSRILSDPNQNDKLPVPIQLFTSPKQSSDSRNNNSQSSSAKSSKHRNHDDDEQHRKHLYKQKHKNNVKKVKPQIYKTSDEDESTDCGQDVDDILESTEDFRPPSLHSPLPACPYPCKDMKSPPTDTKSLAILDSSISSLTSPLQKTTKSPQKLEKPVKQQLNISADKDTIVVKINLSLIKKLSKDSQSALKRPPVEDRKPVKVKKENANIVSNSEMSKSSENSMPKENKKSKKVHDSVDESYSKKEPSVSPVKPKKEFDSVKPKKESDSVKSSTFKIESETTSVSSSKKSGKSSETSNSKDSETKKEKDKETSSSSKKDTKDSSSRTKEAKPNKRKSESSLSSDSAKKHKTSSSSASVTVKTSSSSSSSSSSSKKSSSATSSTIENGIDTHGAETGEEKRPSSRTERRNSSSSTSSRHSNKSQSKKPKIESKSSSKDSTSDKPVKNVVQNGESHIPFSNYSDSHDITSSPAKLSKSSTPSSHTKPSTPLPDSDQVDYYLSQGTDYKHKADSQKDNPIQPITYVEAVLAYLQGGMAMERKKISETAKAFTLYNSTLQLLKAKWRFSLDQSSREKKLAVLILRIHSLLSLKLYSLKKNEAMKFKKIIEGHDQNKVSKPSHAPSPHQGWNNRSTGIPSPMSPTPSPAGSIGSVGSQGSCEFTVSKGTNGTSLAPNATAMASPGSVSVPQRIHSVTQQYLTITSYLVNAVEYWEHADQSSNDFHAFFDHLNKTVGPLTFTQNSFPQLIAYVQKGLQSLKDT